MIFRIYVVNKKAVRNIFDKLLYTEALVSKI